MSTYAIGDVQGCYNELMNLLEVVQFNPKKDFLWFTGDLVNRGLQSLEVLRFVKSLGERAVTVLGNHDLHFLAVLDGLATAKEKDTFHDILAAKDARVLADWLRAMPLLHHDEKLNFVLVHAGIAPLWNLAQAKKYAQEVHEILVSDQYHALLANMYGDKPDRWSDDLCDIPRWRVILNYFTRMRYCDAQGHLDLRYKGPLGKQPENYYPWFDVPQRKVIKEEIIFGHWASLRGRSSVATIHALDTGCSWGAELTALRLEDHKMFQISCTAR